MTNLTTDTAFSTSGNSLPRGFRWAATKAGIKASGKLDLALAVAPAGATAAVMYTRNQVVAAPVTVGREHMAKTQGRVRAVLINAGNANCATGEPGISACKISCDAAAAALGCAVEEIFPSSTGIIGVPLPAEKLTAAIPAAIAGLGDTAEDAALFARAILTTDTKPKTALATIEHGGKTVHIFGACKGAGMIGPQLGPPHATMLVYLFTDVAACAEELRTILQRAVEPSFNSISIDGDTSTNDTVLLLASGASGIALSDGNGNDVRDEFAAALDAVCHSLAHQIVDDGEGVTHVVTLSITGAKTEGDARTIARSIAHSPLCKTAWSSGDPNWGRILAAAGYSGVAFDPAKVNIRIGEHPVLENGMRSPAFDEAATHQHMLQREYTIHFALGEGTATTRFITCDLTAEYVSINADYST